MVLPQLATLLPQSLPLLWNLEIYLHPALKLSTTFQIRACIFASLRRYRSGSLQRGRSMYFRPQSLLLSGSLVSWFIPISEDKKHSQALWFILSTAQLHDPSSSRLGLASLPRSFMTGPAVSGRRGRGTGTRLALHVWRGILLHHPRDRGLRGFMGQCQPCEVAWPCRFRLQLASLLSQNAT